MNVKVIIGLCVVMCVSFFSCSQDEEIFSCDKEVNAWVKENMADIQKMSRRDWSNLDGSLQQGVYVAFAPEQKHIFWLEKIQETLFLEWNNAEKEHIQLLYQTVLDNPQWFASDFSADEQEWEKFEIFTYKWIEYSKNELSWSNSVISSIIMTGYKVENTNGVIQMPQNNQPRLKSGVETKCNCSTGIINACGLWGSSCESGSCESTVRGCGVLWLESCDGLCGGV